MAYQVLYRTYRPAKFSEVVGQDYIVKTLQNAIRVKKIAHAYLFCGPRGTGKTSVAKIFAKAINCTHYNGECCDECDSCKAVLSGNHPDIIELDAASNNSVNNIREIVEEVNYAPMIGKYKVYIIDEVHMLSASAFNALLKTLEEPPAHVVFILATTDPQKIIPTVLSRCQRYNFSKIRTFDIKRHLIDVLKNEGIAYEDKAVEEIASLAEGGMRDALSILEQCLSYNTEGVYLEDIRHIFGLTSTAEKVDLLKKIHQGHIEEVITTVREMYREGTDIRRLTSDLLEVIKESLIYSDSASDTLLNRLNKVQAQDILRNLRPKTLLKDADYLEETLGKDRQNQNFILYFELCLLKMAHDTVPYKEQPQEIPETKPETIEKPAEKPVIIETSVKEDPVSEPVVREEIPVRQAETIPQPETIPEPVIEEVEEPVKQEDEEEKQRKEEEERRDLLISILLKASKEEKINDELIYNRLELYKLEAEKRKFYEMLTGTSIFASSNEAIIVHGSDTKTANINFPVNNEELYHFINEEFGIDKMVYAVRDDDLKGLIEDYKKAVREKRRIDVTIKKYETVHEETKEEKLRRLFGNVKVEE